LEPPLSTAIVWLRNDLRLSDSPALSKGASDADRVVAVYVHETQGTRPPGAAGRWWLNGSLTRLAPRLAEVGVELRVEAGDPEDILIRLAADVDAEAVYWNRRYAPGECELDTRIKTNLQDRGLAVLSCPGNVLVEPWQIATGQGKPYSVYTPFWKTLRGRDIDRPIPAIEGKAIQPKPVDGDYHQPHWAGKLGPHWDIGEEAAQKKLHDFFERIASYPEGRDFPARAATSHLSPHLRWGEITPRQIWHAALHFAHAHHARREQVDKFLSELAWRDFNYHQLHYREDIATVSMHAKYEGIKWRHAPADLEAWQQGRTGVPMVDAGMRELWETGYMENRVRMLTASFLTKNLLIDWRLGEQWFWDCLLDGDMANNPGNWQWVAGSGMDASPFFRIFNPVTQGERFDAEGDYVRRWVPEVAKLPDAWVHQPWEAPPEMLRDADIELGKSYPHPIADLRETRQRALAAVKRL
jgi:deoxyribodipyrimidine photo-lyase